MTKKYYQSLEDDETELPDLNFLAQQNIFDDDDETYRELASHYSDLPEDNAIREQDPSARLGRDLA